MKAKNTNILLSVIVPTYNTGKYLCQCMDTLMAQTMSNMEIIVIDDCSDENIRKNLSRYLLQNNKTVHYERLEIRRGPGGARNYGLEMASGKYVAFCDSDDWVDITYYQDCVDALERHTADMAMCSLVRAYDYMQKDPLYKCRYDRELSLTGDFALKILTKQIDAGILIIPSSVNKVYRKEYLEQLSLRFVEDRLFEDLLFSFICIMNATRIICVPNATYHHYKRPNSIVQSFDRKHIDDFAAVFTQLRNYLDAENRYEEYRFNYYKYLEQYYNLIVREIFEFVPDEKRRKEYLAESFHQIRPLIVFSEYMEYTTAEQLRQHIQPHITDTTIY